MKTFYDVDLSWEELTEKGYFITFGGNKREYKKYASGKERPMVSLGSELPAVVLS